MLKLEYLVADMNAYAILAQATGNIYIMKAWLEIQVVGPRKRLGFWKRNLHAFFFFMFQSMRMMLAQKEGGKYKNHNKVDS